jgi:glutathione S-transferase
MSTDLELIGAPQSIFVRGVRLACHEKGVAYRMTPADPYSVEVAAIHPYGRIPVMRHGDLMLFESRAITTYLDRAFEGPPLTPVDPIGAARAEQWISVLNTTILPTLTAFTRSSFFPSGRGGMPDRAVLDPLIPQIENHLAVLSAAITPAGCLGADRFGLPDMGLMPILAYLMDLPESGRLTKASPTICAYFERHSARTSWIETTPPPLSELGR